MVKWNLSLLLGFSVLWTKLRSHHAFPTGAPSSSCENMLPFHTGTQPQSSPAPYEFQITTPSFINGQLIHVQIVGAAYRGLLLEARTFGSPAALGFWQIPPNNTKLLQCSGNPHGAVTHSNTNLKTSQTTYTWLPPSNNCPRVVEFVATIAQSHDIYWTNVKSKVIWRNPNATCGQGPFANTLSGAMVLFCLLLNLLEYN